MSESPASRRYRKRPVEVTAHQWWENGDHPDDGPPDQEGKVVRYFRRPEPEYSGTHDVVMGGESQEKAQDPAGVGKLVVASAPPNQNEERPCGRTWHEHGWIDTREGGHTVCPGDFVITGVRGERYPCKPDIFAETYEAVEG